MNAESAETAPPLPEIAGYRVLRRLGQGGMAEVYLAIQLSLQREVAIKLLALENAVSDELAQRFEREARTIARLDHPHIVGIHEVGRSSTGLPYYTMPYLPNGHLGRRRLRGDSRAVLAALRALVDALAYAHAHGVVHRDIKPDNVLFDKNDRPLLTDFGIALATTIDHDHRVTERGRTLGSSGYMSPEQARGSDVDARADLYSLGVVCHELLTGDLPFQGIDALSMAMAHVEDPVPRLPAALAAWQPFLDRAMAKSPNDRYQDAAEMRAGLDAVERALDAPPVAPPAPCVSSAASSSPSFSSFVRSAASSVVLALRSRSTCASDASSAGSASIACSSSSANDRISSFAVCAAVIPSAMSSRGSPSRIFVMSPCRTCTARSRTRREIPVISCSFFASASS